jgi:GTP cyclohydrolase I
MNNNGHKRDTRPYQTTEVVELEKSDFPTLVNRIDFTTAPIAIGSDEPEDVAIESAIRQVLLNVGEDPQRDGLLNTPLRVRKMYRELLAGYETDPVAVINNALFDVDYDEMVIVKDIELQSLCEHHMLPFTGRAHVAYIPNGKVLGLSKIPRIVDMYSRRLQVQERMTTQIADFLEETLNPLGVAVVVEASHMCATLRGVKKANTRMVTSSMRGEFKEDRELRREFMEHINRPSTQELY